jgi:transketolase
VTAQTRRREPTLAWPVASNAGWGLRDVRAVNTVRLLAADAVQRAGSATRGPR